MEMSDRSSADSFEEMSLRHSGSAQQQPGQHSLVPPVTLDHSASGAASGGVLQRLLSTLSGLDASQPRLRFWYTTEPATQHRSGGGSSAEPDAGEAHAAASPAVASATATSPEHQAAAEPAAELGEGRAAEAAERHRLSSSVLDIRQLAGSIEAGLPYAGLLLLLFVYRHALGLLSFACLTYVLHRINVVIRAQVALKAQLQPQQLLAAGGVALLQVPLVCLVTWRQQTLKHLVLLASGPPITQFWDVLFMVAVADICVRYISVVTKVVVLLSARVDSAQLLRRRGHVLTAVEYCSGLYRGLLPVPLWYNYFQAAEAPLVVTSVSSGVYILLKCTNMYTRLTAAGVAIRQAFQQSAHGTAPTQEDITEAGNCCPICQDNLRAPIKLSCGHIFCEDCVSEWFERERSCPMCRAAVRPSSLKSHADGATTLLPILM